MIQCKQPHAEYIGGGEGKEFECLRNELRKMAPVNGRGSGKTYTMQPLPLKASQDIFRLMHYNDLNQEYQLFVSFFEIYGGKLFDLLNDRKKLCMREDGKQQVCIVGLQEFRVSDVDTIKELIERGKATRSTGTTGANEEFSRSHAILQLAIKKSVDGKESKPARLVGKLSFIDLAESERGADTTDNDKQTRILRTYSNISNRFGWPKKSEIEPTESFTFERVPKGQVESSSTSQVFQVKVVEDYYEPNEETREQDNRFQTRNSTQTNAKNTTTSEARKTNSDEEVVAILKEENVFIAKLVI
ncbi:hypothetical protein AgCh_011152 [Apium graveolens]